MNVEMRVSDEAYEKKGLPERLGLVLGPYGELVPHALVCVDRQDAHRVACRIDLAVRWWGRMTVEHVHEDAAQAVDLALSHVHELLDAFVSDLPAAGLQPRARPSAA